MKFGETFTEYLQSHEERFLEKSGHVQYKRLKKVLKSCRSLKDSSSSSSAHNNNGHEDDDDDDHHDSSLYCQYESCPVCDQKFFSELMKAASDVSGCLSSEVGRLLQLQVDNRRQRFIACLRQCCASPRPATAEDCQMLIEYVMMNAVAMRKILKKYDKVHGSANGMKFKSKMRAEHLEILQSPWLIELGAFYINNNESNSGNSNELFNPFSCDLSASEPVMTLILPDNVKLEYNLTCAICLELVFNPFALGCGHLFCKSCACSAASVMIDEGPKSASLESKCAVCREKGVYSNAKQMKELNMLLKKRCEDYWKERMLAERAERVKQSKEYWDLQTKYMLGY